MIALQIVLAVLAGWIVAASFDATQHDVELKRERRRAAREIDRKTKANWDHY